jgi:xylulokinase
LAATGEAPEAVCTKPDRLEAIAPDPALTDAYAAHLARYRALYPALKGALS